MLTSSGSMANCSATRSCMVLKISSFVILFSTPCDIAPGGRAPPRPLAALEGTPAAGVPFKIAG